MAKIAHLTGALLLSAVALPGIAAAGSSNFKTVYRFNGGSQDGAQPLGRMAYANGTLYGATETHGLYGEGVLYQVNAASGAETLLQSFGQLGSSWSNPYSVIYGNGVLDISMSSGGTSTPYGGAVVRYDLATGKLAQIFQANGANGSNLQGIAAGGNLVFATTQTGGTGNNGSVFGAHRNSGKIAFTDLFTGGPDGGGGAAPDLAYASGSLYGATFGGGAGYGVIFKIDVVTGAESVVYTFQGGTDGAYPNGVVVHDGTLYGTTSNGGAGNEGTIFKLDPTKGTITTLFAFDAYPHGGQPTAPPIAVKNHLYGTASLFGTYNAGTIYDFDLKSGKLHLLYTFTGTQDGYVPFGPLTYANGTFYGTTEYGGNQQNGNPEGNGTIFSFTP